MRLTAAAAWLAALLPAALPANATGIDAATGARLLAATVRITAYCGGQGQRVATGFVWGAPRQIVTDLHEVIGCDHFDLRFNTPDGAKLVQGARVTHVLVAADLALLQADDAPPVQPLTDSERPLLPGEEVTAWGYPLGIIAPLDTSLTTAFANELYPELRTTLDDAARADLENLHFPSLSAHVLHLNGPLQPGDSGAPIVDSSGAVVGVASGGLRQGAASIAWAMRSEYLASLPASTDQPPDAASAASLFAYETVHEDQPALTAPAAIRCGGLSLIHSADRPLSQLVATAENRGRLPALAALLGVSLDALGGETYSVWSELTSGAVAVLPPGATLAARDGYCVAGGLDPAIDLVLRLDPVSDAADTPEWEFAVQQDRWHGSLLDSRLAGSLTWQKPVKGWSEHRIANGADILRRVLDGQKAGHPAVLVYKSDLAGRGAAVSLSAINRKNGAGQDARARGGWARVVLAAALASFPAVDATAPAKTVTPDDDPGTPAPSGADEVKSHVRQFPLIGCGQGTLLRLSRVYRVSELAADLADPAQFGRDLQAETGVSPDAIADAQYDVWGHTLSGEIAAVPRGAVPQKVPAMVAAGLEASADRPGCRFSLPGRDDVSWLVYVFHGGKLPVVQKTFLDMLRAALGARLSEPRLMPSAQPKQFARFGRWEVDGTDASGKALRVYVAGVAREESIMFVASTASAKPLAADQQMALHVAPTLLFPAPAE